MRSTFKRSLTHVFKSWKHHGSLQFATFLVLTVSFSVMLGIMTVTKNLQNILTLWGDSLQMSVFIDESATEENVANLKGFLAKNKKIDSVKFVSSEQALHDFKEQMASYAPGLLNEADLLKFIPTSFQLTFKNSLGTENQLDDMKSVANEIKSIDGVDEVSFGQDWVKNYSMITKTIQVIGTILIFVTAFGGLFVISNSIRASIAQRKNEIEVLELIGASQNYIRTPFIIEGAFLGLGASLLATLLCFSIFYWSQQFLHQQLSFLQLSQHIRFLDVKVCALVCTSGMIFGTLSAWLCVRKMNSGWAAASAQIIGEQ